MSITVINTHLLNFLYREQSCIRDKVYGAVVRRAVVMVFASPSANFYTGSNSRRLSGLSHLDHFIVTANSSPLIGTVQKHMPTRTQTATPYTTGPLAHSKQQHMRHFVFLLLLISSLTINAQLKGKILNTETREPIPFANIAIENTIFGTTSNFNGSFQFTEVFTDRRLVISSVGFETQYFSASDSVVEILLQPKTYEIDLVTVKPPKNRVETRVNEIPSRNSSTHLSCNGYPWMSARYFDYKTVYQNYPFIKEIRVLTHSQIEGSKFNIRIIAANDKGEPSEEIIGENIIVSTPKGNHILTVDLAYLNLIFPENGLFVALEWLIIDENKWNYVYKMKGEKEKRHEIRYDPMFGAYPKKGRILTWSYSGGRWMQSSFEDQNAGTYQDLAIEVVLSE